MRGLDSSEHGHGRTPSGVSADVPMCGHARVSAGRRARFDRPVRVRRRDVLAARRVRAGVRGGRILRSRGAHGPRRLHLSRMLGRRRPRPRDRRVRPGRRGARPRGSPRGVLRRTRCADPARRPLHVRSAERVVPARERARRHAMRPSSSVPARVALRRERVPGVRLRIGTRPAPRRRGSVRCACRRDRRRSRHGGALLPHPARRRARGGRQGPRRGARVDRRARPGPYSACRRDEGASAIPVSTAAGNPQPARESGSGFGSDAARTASRPGRRSQHGCGGSRRHLRAKAPIGRARRRGKPSRHPLKRRNDRAGARNTARIRRRGC